MENKNDVKGGIVIEQLKRYAKCLSDHTGDSASIKIEVWCSVYENEASLSVQLNAWNSSDNKFLSPKFPTEDLRKLGDTIDDYIENTKGEREK